jgi:hypothetical protein
MSANKIGRNSPCPCPHESLPEYLKNEPDFGVRETFNDKLFDEFMKELNEYTHRIAFRPARERLLARISSTTHGAATASRIPDVGARPSGLGGNRDQIHDGGEQTRRRLTMSTRAERKREARKADRRGKERRFVEAFLDEKASGWRCSNETFLPDDTLRPLLVAGARAAGADMTTVFVTAHEDVNDTTHPLDDGTELHLAVPPQGGDALQSATELFRRIVTGWSFIANIQHGGNDGYAEMCKDCVAVVVKEHASLIQELAAAYAKQAA